MIYRAGLHRLRRLHLARIVTERNINTSLIDNDAGQQPLLEGEITTESVLNPERGGDSSPLGRTKQVHEFAPGHDGTCQPMESGAQHRTLTECERALFALEDLPRRRPKKDVCDLP